MGAKACPSCGLKNPSIALTCDCGHEFRAPKTEAQVCPHCDSVWAASVPQCSCGHWFDEEQEQALTLYRTKLVRGWLMFVGGSALAVLGALVMGKLVIAGGFVIVWGMRSIAFAHHGLRDRARPVKPPQARVVAMHQRAGEPAPPSSQRPRT